jgi:predicted ATP-grasp superfamily ATP-dependent carboligase
MDALILDERPTLSDPTLLLAFTGWSDAGAAASTAVQYAAERLEARKFAAIEVEDFFDFTVERPVVRLDEHQIRSLEWPSYDFRHGQDGRCVFLVGPEPHLRWRTFCAAVTKLVHEAGVGRIAMLGAFLAEVLYTDPVPLTGFASDRVVLERLRVPSSGYQGPTGIIGALADACRRESIPVVSLWAAIPHYIAATPNPRGALALLLRLREWVDLAIDLAPLEAAASAFQAQLLEAVENNAKLSSYIRGLKKQETSH